MPRHSRIKSDSNIYHIMSRALNKQLLFDEEIDYLKFLQILSIVKKEFKLRVYAYCLMSNHVHLIVRDTSKELSHVNENDNIFKWIQTLLIIDEILIYFFEKVENY